MLAAAIEQRKPDSADENAALIAEHLEAADVLHGAYGWHMRAATWATDRDIAAARLSWERARKIADALPTDDPDRAAMRIASRTILCANAWRADANVAGARFEELRELCTAVGDKASLAIAMAGLVIDQANQARIREASQLASEAMALIESVGDPNLTVALTALGDLRQDQSAEMVDALRWAQRAVDLAGGDPSKGNILVGSPLPSAFAARAMARCWPGSSRMARRPAPWPGHGLQRRPHVTRSGRHLRLRRGDIEWGAPADDSAMREIEEALRIAERSSDDFALTFARMTLGVALVHRESAAERERGQQLLARSATCAGAGVLPGRATDRGLVLRAGEGQAWGPR